MVIIMKATSSTKEETFEMVMAYFTVPISKSGQISSITENGSKIFERAKDIATITMKICTSASGKLTRGMGSVRYSRAGRTGTKASGRMT